MSKSTLSVLLFAALAVGCGGAETPEASSAGNAAVPEAAEAQPEGEPEFAQRYVAELVARLDASPELRVINQNEALYAAVRAQILAPWEETWRARQAAGFTALLAEGAEVPAWASSAVERRAERDGIIESRWALVAGEDAAEEASQYLAGFSRIDAFRIETLRVRAVDDAARLEIRYDLRGIAGGARRHDRGTLQLSAVQQGEQWRIASIAPVAMERLQTADGREPAFQHATAAAGLSAVPVVDRREAIRRGGYAIASSDYDGDGDSDLLVGNYNRVQLFRNTGSSYEDVTEESGIQGEELVKAAAFVDLDNDGNRDLVLLRFVVDEEDSIGDFVAYRNMGDGHFELRADVLPRSRRYDRAMPLTLADFDRNGFVDIYVGFPGSRDFTNNLEDATRESDLHSQGVWLNHGDWDFREVAQDHEMVQANSVYPHSAVASDIDQDGHVDVVVVDDSGRINPVYRNLGTGQFQEVTSEMGLAAAGWSMGLSTADYDGDGDLDIVTTNVALLAGRRIAQSVEADSDSEMGQLMATLRSKYVGALLYRNDGDSFAEVAETAGIGWIGDGAGGAEWVDYNADGHLDLYVPNGLWSAGPQEFDSAFIRAVAAYPSGYGQDSDVIHGSVFAARPGDPNPMLTTLRNFTGLLPGAEAVTASTLSLGGHQRNRLFRNQGDGTFVEVGYLEAADRTEDGYVISAVDYDRDGRQDLILRNTDPAPNVQFEAVTVLHNTYGTGRSVTIQAHAENDVDGIGATLTAWVGQQRLVREIRATNGATQSDPAAYFGLGSASRIDRVQVRWPSGQVERFGPQTAGRVALRQGTGRPAR